jgi:hypothetical protein
MKVKKRWSFGTILGIVVAALLMLSLVAGIWIFVLMIMKGSGS